MIPLTFCDILHHKDSLLIGVKTGECKEQFHQQRLTVTQGYLSNR